METRECSPRDAQNRQYDVLGLMHIFMWTYVRGTYSNASDRHSMNLPSCALAKDKAVLPHELVSFLDRSHCSRTYQRTNTMSRDGMYLPVASTGTRRPKEERTAPRSAGRWDWQVPCTAQHRRAWDSIRKGATPSDYPFTPSTLLYERQRV